MSKPSIKGTIVQEYLEKYPDSASKTLAILIYKENKKVFKDEENVRSTIRYYRGAIGKASRKAKNISSPVTPKNKWNIPKSDKINYSAYHINSKFNKGVILSDIHFPYHDKIALETTLEYIDKNKDIEFILLNGDIIDFHSISHFQKDPRARNIGEEIETLKNFFRTLKKNFPNKKIIYKEGNHEVRYDNYIWQKAPELFHIDAIQLHEILELKKYDIDWINNKRIIKYNNLNILHGHEYNGASSPVNPARGMFLKAKKSVLVSHFHQSSEHTENTISGDIITCWSCGCLCDMHPQYAPLNKWNHGFAVVRNDAKHYFVENKRIINSSII